MPNHVHIIAVPSDEDGLRRTFRHVHRHYTGYINARLRVTGHLWQGCFSSVAMVETRLAEALRYVALSPTRARLVSRPADWRALIAGIDDHVVKVAPEIDRIGSLADFLGKDFDGALTYAALRKAESVDHPASCPEWLADMKRRIGKPLAATKRGRKQKIDWGILSLPPQY